MGLPMYSIKKKKSMQIQIKSPKPYTIKRRLKLTKVMPITNLTPTLWVLVIVVASKSIGRSLL
jgi:hypothetical protein